LTFESTIKKEAELKMALITVYDLQVPPIFCVIAEESSKQFREGLAVT
jgi:hypothetical protein